MTNSFVEHWVQYNQLDKLYGHLPGLAAALPAVLGPVPAAPDLQDPDGVRPSLAGQAAIARALVHRLATGSEEPTTPGTTSITSSAPPPGARTREPAGD